MNRRATRCRIVRLGGAAGACAYVFVMLAACGEAADDPPRPARAAAPAPTTSVLDGPAASGASGASGAATAAAADPAGPTPDARPTAGSPPAGVPSLRFTDITDETGIDVRYRSRPGEDYHLPGIMGGGLAAFDADGDGRTDLYFIDGHDGTPESPYRNRLFLQQPDGRFRDATDSSGLGDRGDGQGCAVGDIDNDGDLDVLVTNYGPDRLFRNEGGGIFRDVTAAAGVEGGDAWSSSAVFLDFDRDGWLDLFVVRYVALDESRECVDDASRPEYCGPAAFPGVADRLYRNRGDGTFEDVSAAAGITTQGLAGLGAVAADLDDDGWIDIFVANDGDPNQHWRNLGDGTFLDEAMFAGTAFNADGRSEAGMGVTAGDPDEDGDLDLFITHFSAETNTLYRNAGAMGFDDDTGRAGLGSHSMPYTGWGTAFADLDDDGDQDLVVVNGTVARRRPPLRDDHPFWGAYAEPNQIYRNDGTGRFEPVPAEETGDFGRELSISRGVVPVDLDGDGDLDLVVTNIEHRTRIYRNETGSRRALVLTVHEPELNREALGARLSIRLPGRTIVRHVLPPGGYLTAAEAIVHVGLAPGEAAESIDVRWLDGTVERFDGSGPGRRHLRRGDGSVVP